jgi:hypothetical protein
MDLALHLIQPQGLVLRGLAGQVVQQYRGHNQELHQEQMLLEQLLSQAQRIRMAKKSRLRPLGLGMAVRLVHKLCSSTACHLPRLTLQQRRRLHSHTFTPSSFTCCATRAPAM